ncbi:hypothetical protein Pfo_004717 [Paulownia fortunei]|nr:hypothetical protein Pfo_004717 [Paulownia fortunei]
MDETTDSGMYEIFQQDFGTVGSPSFETAGRIYLLVVLDMKLLASCFNQRMDTKVAAEGHRPVNPQLVIALGMLVHMDFGFIFETSPGGNKLLGSAHFKLSHEMTQLIDPSVHVLPICQLVCEGGHLVARRCMDGILNTVLRMMESGLPCFSRGDPIGNLRKRFHSEMTEHEVANFMIHTCCNKWTTAGYD